MGNIEYLRIYINDYKFEQTSDGFRFFLNVSNNTRRDFISQREQEDKRIFVSFLYKRFY